MLRWIRDRYRRWRQRRREGQVRNQLDDARYSEELSPSIDVGDMEVQDATALADSSNSDVCNTPPGTRRPISLKLPPQNLQQEAWEREHQIRSSAPPGPFQVIQAQSPNMYWNKEQWNGLGIEDNGIEGYLQSLPMPDFSEAVARLRDSDTLMSVEDNDKEESVGQVTHESEKTEDLHIVAFAGKEKGYNHHPNSVTLSHYNTASDTAAHDDAVENCSSFIAEDQHSPDGGLRDGLPNEEKSCSQFGSENSEGGDDSIQIYERGGDGMLNREDPAPQGANKNNGGGGDGMLNREDPAPQGANQNNVGGGDGMPNREDPAPQGANQNNAGGGDGMPNQEDYSPEGANQNNAGGGDGMPNREDHSPEGASQNFGGGGDGMFNREDPIPQGASQNFGGGGDGMFNREDPIPQGANQNNRIGRYDVSNRVDPAPQSANQNNGGAGDGILERGRADPKGAIPRTAAHIQVYPDKCKHLLKETTFNARDDLSEELDKECILHLMRKRISLKEFEHVWRSCHGGSDPAMNLLIYLDGLNCTLGKFTEYVDSEKRDRTMDLKELLARHHDCMNKRIRDLDFGLLSNIAELIGAKPNPNRRPLWKRLASRAGLREEFIGTLDCPNTGQKESLTMAFIKFICHKRPKTKVAWLMEGLVVIERIDLLQSNEFEIFSICREHGCVVDWDGEVSNDNC